MATITYRKVKCDNCGKEVELKDETGFTVPHRWFEITITEGKKGYGQGIFTAEVCSKECTLKKLHSIKKLPQPISYV